MRRPTDDERELETRHDDLSAAGRAGGVRRCARQLEPADRGVDGDGLYRTADVLRLGASRTPLPCADRAHGRVHDQPHHGCHGACRRLVRRPFGSRLRQIPRDGTHAPARRGSWRLRRWRSRPLSSSAACGRSCRSGRTTCFWRRSSTCWSTTATSIPPRGVSIWNEQGLVAYSHGEYFRLGELIGHFGWSVRRRKIIVRERKGRR